MGVEEIITADDLPVEVVDAVKDGRRIEAIRLLRERTGMGLANAKVLIDTAARRHGVPPVAPALVQVRSIPFGLLKALALAALLYAGYYILNNPL